MQFSPVDLLVIGIVLIILAIYRQMDKNNRSLEKVKKFTDKAKDDLDGIVVQKAAQIKDLAIELEVHQKAAREVLKRIQSVEEDLNSRAADIETIGTRISEYDRVIDELVRMTGQAEENVGRLRTESEFSDGLARRIQQAAKGIEQLEKEIPGLVHDFEKRNESQLTGVARKVAAHTEQRIGKFAESVNRAEVQIGEFATFVDSLEARGTEVARETEARLADVVEELIGKVDGETAVVDQAVEEKLKEYRERMAELEEEYEGRLAEAARRGEALETRALQVLKEHIEGRLRDTVRQQAELVHDLEGRTSTLGSTVERTEQELGAKLDGLHEEGVRLAEALAARIRQELEGQGSDLRREIEERLGSLRTSLESTERELGGQISGMREQLTRWRSGSEEILESYRDDLQGRVKEIQEQVQSRIDRSTQDMVRLDGLANSVEERIGEMGVRVDRFSEDLAARLSTASEEVSSGVLGRVEQRFGEYEESVSYRLERIETVGKDMEQLEQDLRASMEKMADRIREEFVAFDRELEQKRFAERQRADGELGTIRDAMGELEQGLSELKARAYDSVSEKLKVFEDEFFADLRERNEDMSRRLTEWQNGVDERFGELSKESEQRRDEVVKQYREQLQGRLGELQEKIYGQMDKFEQQVSDFQEGLRNRIGISERSIASFEESFRNEFDEMQRDSVEQFRKEYSQYNHSVSEQVKRFEREIEGRLKSLTDQMEAGTGNLSSLLATAKSDMTVWQTKVLQQMKEAEAAVSEQVATFRIQVSEDIGDIREDFSAQKKMIDESLKAMEREADQKLREFRASVQDTRDSFEALQAKLYGKAEEHSQVLSAQLSEIDKRQKNFVEQTRIFERADSMKISLQESIEDMKAELARTETQRKELKEIENQFVKLRKISEEMTAKMSRFLSERHRIEILEGDFKKLISLSQNVDSRLSEVMNSSDALQNVEVRLRSVEGLEKEVETRFQRLEQKRNVLDVTSDGIDRNFRLLEGMEKQLQKALTALEQIPSDIGTLGGRLDELEQNRDKVDTVLRKVREIDTILSDLEGRTEQLQKVRDWLARSETRLEEVGREAQQQVKLFESLLKEGGKSTRKERGAPPMGIREMVTKLAHQGWTVEEIAKHTKLSRGEVELILEIVPR